MEHDELRALAADMHKRLKTVVRIKHDYKLEMDDLLMLLALGVMNFDPKNDSMLMVLPMKVSAIATFVDVPRETVRRKLVHLGERHLIYKTTYGYMVKDTNLWKTLVHCFTAAGMRPADRNSMQRSNLVETLKLAGAPADC